MQTRIATARAQHPGCWIVEVHKGSAACLIAIPARPEFIGRRLQTLPELTVDALDGRIIARPA